MTYTNFKVSVRCFTYNHSKYITDAMNGFVMQQTNFPFICSIVDDASTDGEQEVIQKYLDDYFDLSESGLAYHKETDYAYITYAQHKTNRNCFFVVLFLKENHYSQKRSKMEYLNEWRDKCKYEAFCEGDDFWITSNKLQMQTDFLDSHSDYGLIKTDVNRKNEVSGTFECSIYSTTIYKNVKETFEDYLLNAWWAAPCTWMYRIGTINTKHFPKDCFHGDIAMLLSIACKYKIYYFPTTTAVYRVLGQSASHFESDKERIRFYHSVANTRCYYSQFVSYSLKARLFYKLIDESRKLLINRTFFFSKTNIFIFYIFKYFVRIFFPKNS